MSTDKNKSNKKNDNENSKTTVKENESNNINKLDLFEEDDLFEEFEEGKFL